MSTHGRPHGRRHGGRRRAGGPPPVATGHTEAPPATPPHRPGSRSQRHRGRRFRPYVPVPFLVAVACLAVFVGAGELILPENRQQVTGLEASKAAVSSARVVCPDAVGKKVGVVAPASGKGDVTVQPLGSSTASPLSSLRTAPGRAVVEPSAGEGAVVASARGATARGFQAAQYSRQDEGDERGLGGVRCARPAADWWFTGATTAGGSPANLYLSNIDRTSATVDVIAYGEDGAIDPDTGRGITVDPGQRQVVELTELAPELSTTAFRVVARSGRVAAALHAGVVDGDTSYGASWVPPTLPKAGNLVVPAVPSGAGKRKLVLFAPGDRGTTVNVRLSTSEGSFAPAGHDRVDVPAKQVVTVDLGDVMTKSASALQLSSDVPVVGSVVAVEGGSGEDGSVAYSTTTPRIDTAATVPIVPRKNVDATLQLTAATEDAQVDVQVVGSDSAEPKRVRIGAGKTVPVELDGPSGEPTYAVKVTPTEGSGPVYGSRLLTASPSEGPLLSAQPLMPGVHSVALPPVVPEIGAGIPR